MRKSDFVWAIIDDGVNGRHPSLIQNLQVGREGTIIERQAADDINHATECAGIIAAYREKLPDFVSIKVIDEDTQRGNVKGLLCGLEWCLKNSIRLIHMSIGTVRAEDFEDIKEIIGRLAEKGVVIVAANSNQGVQTYPAYDSRVIGVECDPALTGRQFSYSPAAYNGIQFRAAGVHKIRNSFCWRDTLPSNSYAAPLITAEALGELEKDNSLNFSEIVRRLQKKALYSQNRGFETDHLKEQRAVAIIIIDQDPVFLKKFTEDMAVFFSKENHYCRILDLNLIPKEKAREYFEWGRWFYASDVLLIPCVSMEKPQAFMDMAELVIAETEEEMKGRNNSIVSRPWKNNHPKMEDFYQKIYELISE